METDKRRPQVGSAKKLCIPWEGATVRGDLGMAMIEALIAKFDFEASAFWASRLADERCQLFFRLNELVDYWEKSSWRRSNAIRKTTKTRTRRKNAS